MARFEVGKTYENNDGRFDPVTVISRTPKTVTVTNGPHTWRMKVRTDANGNEYVMDSSAGRWQEVCKYLSTRDRKSVV